MIKINELVVANGELRKRFYRLVNYIEKKNIKNDLELFVNPEYRMEIILKVMEEYSKTGNEQLKKLLKEYFEIENLIVNLSDGVLNDFKYCEKSLDKIKRRQYQEFDIDMYFYSLEEAYINYLRNDFAKPFKIYSSEMRSSIHSVENGNCRNELEFEAKIEPKELLHLIKLPSLNQKDNCVIKIYNAFKKEDNFRGDDENLQAKDLMDFVVNYLSNYFKFILFDITPRDEKTKKIIESLDVSKEEILEFIYLSFEKTIGFRKLYEYKLMPEIVLDYSQKGSLEKVYSKKNDGDVKYKERFSKETNGGYSYRKYIEALSFISGEMISLKDIVIECNGRDYKLKDGIILSDSERIFLEKILEYFDGNLEIKVEKGEKSIFKEQKGMYLIFDPTDAETINSLSGIKYKYFINSGEIKSDLPVNTFLLSYDRETVMKDIILDTAILHKALLIIILTIVKEIPSEYLENKLSEDIVGKYNFSRIFNMVSENWDFYHNYDNYDKNNIDKYINNVRVLDSCLRDSKRPHLLNMEYISGLAKHIYNNKLADLLNIKIDLASFLEEKDLKEIVKVIKGVLVNNLASIHYMRDFGLVASSSSSTNKDEAPLVNVLLKPAQRIKNELELDRSDNFKTIDIVGFSIKRENPLGESRQGRIEEKYPKTFVSRTVLQLLTDLRTNGWSYNLDAVYEDSGDEINYFNIIPLKKYNKFIRRVNKEFDQDVLYSIALYNRSMILKRRL